MTKDSDNKSKVQGEQSKEVDKTNLQASKDDDYKVEFLIDQRLSLEEAAKFLNRSIEKIIDYANSGVIKIDYMVSNGYVAELTEKHLDMFAKDINTEIDVPKTLITILRRIGYSTDGKEYVISKGSLRVNEKDLSDLRDRLADEAEDEGRPSLYDGDKQKKGKCAVTAVVPLVVPDGTKWSDVGMKFINKETIEIIVGETKCRKNFSEMGFKDGRNGDSDRAWKRLVLFAFKDKRITYKFNETLKHIDEYYVKPKDIESINKKLRTFFQTIEGKPIQTYDRKEHCYKIELKHIEISNNYMGHLAVKITERPQDDDREFEDYNYLSASFSAYPEDNPCSMGDDDDDGNTSY